MVETLKTCSRCKESKPLDAFHKGPSEHGRAYACKTCKTKYRVARFQANRERILEYRKEYYAATKVRIQEYHRESSRGNATSPTTLASSTKRCTQCGKVKSWDQYYVYGGSCKECRRAYFRKRQDTETYRQRNRASTSKWHGANRDKVRHQHRLRSARLRGAEGAYSRDEFLAKCEAAGWKCEYCGKKLSPETVTADHMVSLAKGGTNSIDNVVPACKPCNDKKYTASVEAFQAREQKRR